MHEYTKEEINLAWWRLTTEQRHDYQTWYAFCEMYKNAKSKPIL